MKIGFNSDLYMEKQSQKIIERIKKFDDKLYLEFGGKLFDDFHAARVLPGFDPNAKIKLLQKLKDQCEIIFCISAPDIERNKMRADFGITYGAEVIRLIGIMRGLGISVNGIVITKYEEQPTANSFKQKLEQRGEKVYLHRYTKGYPNDVDTIVSDEGYGQNPYIETTKPLVVVTAPGPSSGKLGTCLGQLYHEYKRGIKAGYAKFETFPVWNLPLKHPVNIAYEAATADIKDVNMIDSYHLEAYNVTTVNYNRDIELFPVIRAILSRISPELNYKSPTDMGVNMVGYCIEDDEVCRDAAKQEIIRRYFTTKCAYKNGLMDLGAVKREEFLMGDLQLMPEHRKAVLPAREKAQESGCSAVAIELSDGAIVTGRKSELLSAPAGAIINALKYIADIDDEITLIAPSVIEPIMRVKKDILREKHLRLDLQEVIIALTVCASFNPVAQLALDELHKLRCTEMHSTVMLNSGDENILRKLGVNVTSDDKFDDKI